MEEFPDPDAKTALIALALTHLTKDLAKKPHVIAEADHLFHARQQGHERAALEQRIETRLGVIGHLDKGEPTGPAADAVGDDRHALHLAVLAEQVAERLLGGLKAEVANVDALHEDYSRSGSRRRFESNQSG